LQSAMAQFWHALNAVDAAIIAVLLLSLALGYATGFVWQALRLGCILAAFWVATVFHEQAARAIGSAANSPIGEMACFAGILLAVLIAAYVVLFLLRRPINALKPDHPDRLLGAVLSTAKGALLCGILALLLLDYGGPGTRTRELVLGSPLARASAKAVRLLWHALPFGGEPPRG